MRDADSSKGLPAQTQGSTNSNWQPAKSPTFRVARAAPRDLAMAAMRASASEIGRPARRRLAAMSRELTSRGAVEGQYATGKILRKNQVYHRLQGLPPPAFRQQGDAVEQLGPGDCRREQRRGRLGAHPFQHSGRRCWAQGFRQYVRVQDDHVKSGGSRIGPRGGGDSSMPPNGSTLLRIASAKFPTWAGCCAKAVRKISRASSSIDRFRCAARSRNFRFTVSSRLRIVMLAMKHVVLKSMQSV